MLTQDAGLGWGGFKRSLHLHTCWMFRKMLGWGGGDVNVPCTCTHVGCYARCWVGVGGILFLALAHMLDVTQDAGVGGMLTFLALAHMLDVTQDAGVGGMLTFLALAHMLDVSQDAGLGWGGC